MRTAILRTQHEELHYLKQVEPGVADHRGGNRSADQVDLSPECAEQRRGQRHVASLFEMAEAEQRAEHDNADASPAEELLEAVQDEAALDFLAHTAGDHD